MAKTFEHAVIYNGVFYSAGATIEDKATCQENLQVETPEKKAVVENDKRTVRRSKPRTAE